MRTSFFAWQDFIDKAKPATSWSFSLLSPTASKIKGRVHPLPQPEIYFASWYYKWQSFAPQELRFPNDGHLLEFIRDRINVTSLSGKIVSHFVHEEEPLWSAFLGTVNFSVHKPKREDAESLKKLDALALLSGFCGTGSQTMSGMGQTRPQRLSVGGQKNSQPNNKTNKASVRADSDNKRIEAL